MKLYIDNSVYQKMLYTAHATVPIEACGLCGGKDHRITHFYQMSNADASAEHFSMLPREQFTVIKKMRQEGLEMLAIWHSHPVTPARMSDEDLRLAYTPNVTYLILSLAIPGKPIMKGFRVGNNKVIEVKICIED